MTEKIYALIAKWEQEWHDLQDKARKHADKPLTEALILDFADKLRKRIDELTELVRD